MVDLPNSSFQLLVNRLFQGEAALVFGEHDLQLRRHCQRGFQRLRRGDLRRRHAPRLLRRLMRDAPPAFHPLRCRRRQVRVGAARDHGQDGGNAQLGRFLDRPLHAIELEDRQQQRQARRLLLRHDSPSSNSTRSSATAPRGPGAPRRRWRLRTPGRRGRAARAPGARRCGPAGTRARRRPGRQSSGGGSFADQEKPGGGGGDGVGTPKQRFWRPGLSSGRWRCRSSPRRSDADEERDDHPALARIEEINGKQDERSAARSSPTCGAARASRSAIVRWSVREFSACAS